MQEDDDLKQNKTYFRAALEMQYSPFGVERVRAQITD